MPRLPSVETMGRRPGVTDRGGIATKRTGQVGAALQELGGTVQGIAQQKIERDARLSSAKARSHLLQADIAARAELDGDPDYETYGDRYAKKMNNARSQATEMIKGNAARELFTLDSELDIARGNEFIRQKAWTREVDSGRADLAALLDTNRTGGLETEDFATRAAFIEASDEAITGAAENGYLGAEEATAMKQKWTDDFAESSVLGMAPDKRVEILSKPKGTLADNIDPARRKVLLDAAKTENRVIEVRGRSQVQADKIVSKRGSLDEQLKEARKIKDPEVRDSTTTRIKNRYKDALTITNAVKNEALNQGYDIALKGGDFVDVPPSVIAAMDPKDALGLKDYMDKDGNVRTDYGVWTSLRQMQGSDLVGFSELNPLEYKANLSDGDYQNLVNDIENAQAIIAKDKNALAAGVGVETEISRVNATAVQAGANNDEKLYQFKTRYDVRVNQAAQELGRIPSFKEKQQILDDMTMDIVTDDSGWFYFSGKQKAFTVTIDDMTDDEIADVRHVLELNNIPVTDQAIVDLFIKPIREVK